MEERFIGCNFSGSDILFQPDETHFVNCNFKDAQVLPAPRHSIVHEVEVVCSHELRLWANRLLTAAC